MSAINSVLVKAECFFFFLNSISLRRFACEKLVFLSYSLEMFKCAVNCVNSIVPTGSSFRLPELFKILKNHTNKMHNRLVAHQSGMLIMLIIPCIVNKKRAECSVYYILLLLHINIWLIMLTVNDGGRDQFLEQSVLSEREMLGFNYTLCSRHSDLTQSLQSVSYVFMREVNSSPP